MFSLSDGLTAIIQLDYGTIRSRDRTHLEASFSSKLLSFV